MPDCLLVGGDLAVDDGRDEDRLAVLVDGDRADCLAGAVRVLHLRTVAQVDVALNRLARLPFWQEAHLLNFADRPFKKALLHRHALLALRCQSFFSALMSKATLEFGVRPPLARSLQFSNASGVTFLERRTRENLTKLGNHRKGFTPSSLLLSPSGEIKSRAA